MASSFSNVCLFVSLFFGLSGRAFKLVDNVQFSFLLPLKINKLGTFKPKSVKTIWNVSRHILA